MLDIRRVGDIFTRSLMHATVAKIGCLWHV